MGQIQGCPPFLRREARPSGEAVWLRPWLQGDAGLARTGSLRGGRRQHLDKPSQLPRSSTRPGWSRHPGCGPGWDCTSGGGEGWSKREKGGRGTREGRGWRGPAGGEGVPGGGAQAEALVPAVGEGECWSGEQNRRAGGRAGAAAGGVDAGLVRAAGTAQRSAHVAFSSQETPSPFQKASQFGRAPLRTQLASMQPAPQ